MGRYKDMDGEIQDAAFENDTGFNPGARRMTPPGFDDEMKTYFESVLKSGEKGPEPKVPQPPQPKRPS